MTDTRATDRGAAALTRVVRRTRAAMALESFARAFWPLGSALAVAWSALAFGLAEVATRPQFLAVAAAAGLGLLALLVLGVRRFRLAERRGGAGADRRDAAGPAARSAGRPSRARARGPRRASSVGSAPGPDAPSGCNGAAGKPRPAPGSPRPLGAEAHGASVVDRGGGFRARSGDRVGRGGAAHRRRVRRPPLGRASRAGPSRRPIPAGRRYTCRKSTGGAPVAVPQGTKITLRVYGAPERFTLSETVSGTSAALGGGRAGHRRRRVSGRGERIGHAESERRRARRLGLHDGAGPAPPNRDDRAAGARSKWRDPLAYKATDDHGIAGARAEISPRSREGRPALRAHDRTRGARHRWSPTCRCRCPGLRREIDETLVEDFSKHPLGRLAGDGAADRRRRHRPDRRSAPVAAVLPVRRFYNPMAQALVEQRRDLLWSTGNAAAGDQGAARGHQPSRRRFRQPASLSGDAIAIRRLAQAGDGDDRGGARRGRRGAVAGGRC